MFRLRNDIKRQVITTIIAIVMGILVAGIILSITGYPPLKSIISLINGIFSRPKYISNVIIKSTPIIFTGLSVAFAFKTGLFNIGAEGQFIMGSIAATITGIMFDFHPIIQIPLIIIAGIIAGALYGAVVGILKAKFGIHEVITSIMLNWIALYFSNYLCTWEAFRKPNTNGTYILGDNSKTLILGIWKKSAEGIAQLQRIPFIGEVILKTDANVGFLIVVCVAIILTIVLKNTTKGFELRAVGFNKYAAEAVGINIKKNIVHAMMISGAIAGLGAALYMTGNSPHKITILSTFENNGFNGLAVALIANSSPIACIFSGLLYGGLLYGGQALQYDVGAPAEIINIVIGTIVFFVAIMPRALQMLENFLRKGRIDDE